MLQMASTASANYPKHHTKMVFLLLLVLLDSGLRVCSAIGLRKKDICFWAVNKKNGYDEHKLQKVLKLKKKKKNK